ncbi:MAG: ribosome biogenesis GTP-binding protein YihA/YsxC [Patescibacteria group bacterium]
MQIKNAVFIKGVVGTDRIFEDGTPQCVILGRSNVGKSSVINSLTNQKKLARVSSFKGSTQEINIFLINKAFYLVDLPGYGFANVSKEMRLQIQKMMNWYLYKSGYNFHKLILVIDADIGPTKDDMEVLANLKDKTKNIIIVANKIDKIKKTAYEDRLKNLRESFSQYKVIPYSASKKTGVIELTAELLK